MFFRLEIDLVLRDITLTIFFSSKKCDLIREPFTICSHIWHVDIQNGYVHSSDT